MARLLPNGRPAGPMSQSRLALAKNIRENAFANHEFSSPAPTKATRINANLRGANFITPEVGGLTRSAIDWDNLVSGAKDPIGTAKGAVEIASLASPAANVYRLANYIKDGNLSVTGANMQDVNQALAYAQFIPYGKAAKGTEVGLQAAEIAGKSLKPAFEAALTSPIAHQIGENTLNAASYGGIKGAATQLAAHLMQHSGDIGSAARNIVSNTTRDNGRLIQLDTGEVLSHPYDEAVTRIESVKSPFDKKAGGQGRPPALTIEEKLAQGKRPTGRDYAREKAYRDPNAEDVTMRPKGKDVLRYQINYVLKDRMKEINKKLISAGRHAEVIDTRTPSFTKNMNKLILNFKREFPGYSIEDADLSHIIPLRGDNKMLRGKNEWNNLRLMPRKMNQDQMTAHPVAYRMLANDSFNAQRFGSLGYGTGKYWYGIPSM